MILVDAKGLPLAVSTASANRAECSLIQELFGFMLSTNQPERVIGDKAYDSDKLDAQLASDGDRNDRAQSCQAIRDSRCSSPPSI
jgi:hypothetical protein